MNRERNSDFQRTGKYRYFGKELKSKAKNCICRGTDPENEKNPRLALLGRK